MYSTVEIVLIAFGFWCSGWVCCWAFYEWVIFKEGA